MAKVKVSGVTSPKESRPPIPPQTLRRLWVNAGGRCQYDGCNKYLLESALVKKHYNLAYVAHIVSYKPNGPRGNVVDSPRLATEYSNLMLLCDECHRLVDEADIAGHPVDLLTSMKRKHEERIQRIAGIDANKNSNVVLFGINIGTLTPSISYSEAQEAMLETHYPASSRPIEFSVLNCAFQDNTSEYWEFHESNLMKLYKEKVIPIIEGDKGAHFSVFPLAPMPLLMKLGTLLSDLTPVSIYQRHREPQTWKWQTSSSPLSYVLHEPADKSGLPILVIELSATITEDRIRTCIPGTVSIWRLTIDAPHNNCMGTREDLMNFRIIARQAFNKIKLEHGQHAVLNVFPAMPVSAAVEFGRVWMPKADVSMILYDQNKTNNTFIPTLTIQ